MSKTKCRKCIFLEGIEGEKGWYHCSKQNLRIHWKWAVNPPEDFPQLSSCSFFVDMEKRAYRCYNDPELFKK